MAYINNEVCWSVSYLDSEISCQLPRVGMILFLLKLNLKMKSSEEMLQPLLNLVDGSLNSPLPHLDIIKLLHKTLFHKVHHLVLANSDHTWRKSVLKTIMILPLLSQPKAFISNFGWFCCLTEHILKFAFNLNYMIRKEYKTELLFHLCQLILFI